MEDLVGPLVVLGLIVAAIVLVFVAMAWVALFACLALSFLAVNLLALCEKALCWTDVLSPSWHWAASGFIIGSILHFAVRESPRTNRPGLRVILVVLAVGGCALSLVLHSQGGASLRWVSHEQGAVAEKAGTAPAAEVDQTPGKAVLWRYSNGEKPNAVGSVDDEGNVYLATLSHLMKLNHAGKLQWDLPKEQQGFTVPVIHDRYVFSGGKELVALVRADGAGAWGKNYSPGLSMSSGRFSSPAVGSDDTLLFSCADKILACRLNGDVLWQGPYLRLDDEWSFSPQFRDLPGILSDGVCVFSLAESVRAARVTSGQRAWWFKPGDGSSPGPAACVGNRVFVVCGRCAYCIDSATQKQVWKVAKDHDLNNEVVVNSDGEVVFGGFDRVYVCRADTGADVKTLYLHQASNEKLTQDALALGSGSLVYVGGNFGIRCLDRATGNTKWACRLGDGGVHGVTVCRDGSLVVRGEDGLYGFAGDSDRGPGHPWPMLYGNEGHTGVSLGEKAATNTRAGATSGTESPPPANSAGAAGRGAETDSSEGASGFIDEFDFRTHGKALGVEYVSLPAGRGAAFSRGNSSRIEYSFEDGFPREGTVEWRIQVRSGYSYDKGVLSTSKPDALIFTTVGPDTWYPGCAWVTVGGNGTVSFDMADSVGGRTPRRSLTARDTGFTFGAWHNVGISFGSKGRVINVDGRVVARDELSLALAVGGTPARQVGAPTIGEMKSRVWPTHQYDAGFDGVVDTFRTSGKQGDWKLCK
jgi:hypothetical protein